MTTHLVRLVHPHQAINPRSPLHMIKTDDRDWYVTILANGMTNYIIDREH
jgi:hypothetical protein